MVLHRPAQRFANLELQIERATVPTHFVLDGTQLVLAQLLLRLLQPLCRWLDFKVFLVRGPVLVAIVFFIDRNHNIGLGISLAKVFYRLGLVFAKGVERAVVDEAKILDRAIPDIHAANTHKIAYRYLI